MKNISREAVLNAESISATANKLAVNLLSVLFTQQELATGNCTKPSRDDIFLLDQEKIQAIRGMQPSPVTSLTLVLLLLLVVDSSPCPA